MLFAESASRQKGMPTHFLRTLHAKQNLYSSKESGAIMVRARLLQDSNPLDLFYLPAVLLEASTILAQICTGKIDNLSIVSRQTIITVRLTLQHASKPYVMTSGSRPVVELLDCSSRD